jgi:hypothetical protein
MVNRPQAQAPNQGRAHGSPDVLSYFLTNIWGIFGLLLAGLSALLGLAGAVLWSGREGQGMAAAVDGALRPIVSVRVGGPITFLCTVVAVFYLYTLRDDLHRYQHTRSFGPKPGRSIAFYALLLFVLAILMAFALSFGLVAKDSFIAPRGQHVPGMLDYDSFAHQLVKLLMTGLMLLIVVSFALSASLMAVYKYGKEVDRIGPLPIYADPERLQAKVLRTVSDELGPDSGRVLQNVERLAGGGISVTVREEGRLVERQNKTFVEGRSLSAEADCWGEITKLEEKDFTIGVAPAAPQPQEPPAAGAPQPAPPEPPVLAQVRRLVNAHTELRVAKYEYLEDGRILLTLDGSPTF